MPIPTHGSRARRQRFHLEAAAATAAAPPMHSSPP
eukprot:CAMPEP_0113587962 /NCGR_PEP_ID=MMETSP0015_2-20120614/35223_1 /TAXON_ID=2838 /ORGANISM="Odontella" /LENGTH=34 /DNA_ID=CAMNT_0000493727 /DNA_START=172 /DNA_END=273 /DNA_ORIENTATION=- /assembly_acc=CAM_ASM_000160